MSVVRLDRDGPVAVLTLDNPTRGNALTPVMMARAAELVSGLGAELTVERGVGFGALVIRGAGERAFCAGYDFASLARETAERPQQVIPELMQVLSAFERFPFPIIAALNGHAIGGGALLASLCDLRYAREGARFRIPTSRIGIVYPLAGIRRLVSLVGIGRAMEILLVADDVSAQQGLAWGLYQGVCTTGLLDERVHRVAHALAERAPLSIQGNLQTLRALRSSASEEDVQALHTRWLGRCVESADLAEGLAAAAERRTPRFEGR